MKIDRQRAKCKAGQPPADVQNLIRGLHSSALQSYNALAQRLSSIKVWRYIKSDFYYWHDVADLFDEILAHATAPVIRSAAATGVNIQSPPDAAAAAAEQPLLYAASHLYLRIDEPQHESLRKVVCEILHFYSLLIENTFSRSSFNSIDRLYQLLLSDNLHVVYSVLVLLCTFARRSNLFARLRHIPTRDINDMLHILASPWDTNTSGAAAGLSLATCCSEKQQLPPSATTVKFQGSATKSRQNNEQQLAAPVINGSDNNSRQFSIDFNICSENNLPTAQIMQNMLTSVNVSLEDVNEKQQRELFHQIRLAKHFRCTHVEMRIMNVQVRLQALTVLLLNSSSALILRKRFLYNGFLEELVDILKLDDENDDDLADVKTCVLRTLLAVNQYYSADAENANSVLQAIGLASRCGTIPSAVREFVDYLTKPTAGARRFPVQYTTALFSFLYHMASLTNGAEALTKADILQVMLRIVNPYSIDTTKAAVTPTSIIISSSSVAGADATAPSSSSPSSSTATTMPLVSSSEESLAITTRAIRVVDLLAKNNLQLFRNAGGFAYMTARLAHEVNCCLQEEEEEEEAAAAAAKLAAVALTPSAAAALTTCNPQRAALMKSIVSFLQKAFSSSDGAFSGSDSLRGVFDYDTRNALKCIIERSDFFGHSLFRLTFDAITSYISREPTSLADFEASGFSQAFLNAVVVKQQQLPATRELIISSTPQQTCALMHPRLVPNVFDKVLLYIAAPADVIVCMNTFHLFGPLACRQLQYCLAQPKEKNGGDMLLLAWPLCMHGREDVGNYWHEMKFYETLRRNVRLAAADTTTADAVDAKMREFLLGYESNLLECVLNNTHLYSNLNVLMLDFHTHAAYHYDRGVERERVNEITSKTLSRWFTSAKKLSLRDAGVNQPHLLQYSVLCVNSQVWARVITGIVTMCAAKLRHFVFIDSIWMPPQFYDDLKFDCLLAQHMQQVETLYMPSILERTGPNYILPSPRDWWHAFQQASVEKHFSSLRRVVIFDTNAIMCAPGEVFVGGSPSSTLSSPFRLTTVCWEELRRWTPRSTLAAECLARKPQNLALQIGMKFDKHDEKALTTYYSEERLNEITAGDPHFRLDIDNLLDVAVDNREELLSVLNFVKGEKNCQQLSTTTIPANLRFPSKFNSQQIENVLVSLSNLSRPLTVTLHYDWERLLMHLKLFSINNEVDSTTPIWSTCFQRGILNLKLCITKGVQEHFIRVGEVVSQLYRILPADRYTFPSNTVIEFRRNFYVQFSAVALDIMPSIRKEFRNAMQELVDDITGTTKPVRVSYESADPGEMTKSELHKEAEKNAGYRSAAVFANFATKNLRTDLYSKCRTIEFSFKMLYMITENFKMKDADVVMHVQRLNKLVQSKQFERELVHEVFGDLICCCSAEMGRQHLLPNLLSISIRREVCFWEYSYLLA